MITPVRHRWFDRWMGAASPNTVRLVEEGIALVSQYEGQTKARRRGRRPADQANHCTMAEAVVANLIHAVLLPPQHGCLAVLVGHSRQPRTRYDHPAFGEPFPALLAAFQGIGWLTFTSSLSMGEASTIEPSVHFAAKVHEAGIKLGDLRRDVGEPIILKRADGEGSPRAKVDYPDTSTSVALRGQMESLNAFLARADIAFKDDDLGVIDIHQRQQRRYFRHDGDTSSISFDRGGRMFGSWWSNLSKARRGGIRIDGEEVCILDYSSMFVRLAYAHIGISPPTGDLYDIPGLQGHRRAAKLIVNCLMFDEHDRKRWPRVSAPDEVMPPGLTMPKVRRAILSHYPSLERCFGYGLGHELMFKESTILVEVMMEMKTRGIVGLGLHDGLMVPAHHAMTVKALMEKVAEEITSVHIPVKEEPIFSNCL